MTTRILILVANPKPKSRTRDIAERLVDALFGDSGHHRETLDLAEHGDRLWPYPAAELADLQQRLSGCDLLVVASPTYKATYTGLLKIVLDQLRPGALDGVAAIPLMTGGGAHHAMAVELHLAPLLRELGATVPAGGAFFVVNESEDAGEAIRAASEKFKARLAPLRSLSLSGDTNVGSTTDHG